MRHLLRKLKDISRVIENIRSRAEFAAKPGSHFSLRGMQHHLLLDVMPLVMAQEYVGRQHLLRKHELTLKNFVLMSDLTMDGAKYRVREVSSLITRPFAISFCQRMPPATRNVTPSLFILCVLCPSCHNQLLLVAFQ